MELNKRGNFTVYNLLLNKTDLKKSISKIIYRQLKGTNFSLGTPQITLN